MSTVQATPSFFTARVNMYVPAMKYAAVSNMDSASKITLGFPAAATATAIASALSIAAAGTTAFTYVADATYGRALNFILSGAGTPSLTFRGRDCWNQPMVETVAGNGAATVQMKKAFKFVDSITYPGTAGVTINIGVQNLFGLPYKTVKVLDENFADVSVTVGTLTQPVLTDPQTVSTGDPRGVYAPTSTPNGTSELTLVILASDVVNAAGNGGLMGIKHVTA